MSEHDLPKKVEWLSEPQQHDYDNAATYLELLNDIDRDRVIQAFKASVGAFYYAKDLIRASQSELLLADNEHVARDLQKIEDGKKLSPVLLVRGQFSENRPLIIADGYHRICAAHWVDENALVRAFMP